MSSEHYSEREKTIIGWTLATKGYISLNWKYKKTGNNLSFYLCPVVGIVSTDYQFLEEWLKVVKVGRIRTKGLPRRNKQEYMWHINKQIIVYNILKNGLPYIYMREVKKLAELVIEFCDLRKLGALRKKPYSVREKEIADEITAINKNRRGGY